MRAWVRDFALRIEIKEWILAIVEKEEVARFGYALHVWGKGVGEVKNNTSSIY